MASVAPVVGLTTYREPARWGVWDQHADLLPTHYARAVELAGGVPVLLPPQAATAASTVLDRLDALVVCGGADVDPASYGEEAHAATGAPRVDRDTWERALLEASRADGTPTLGVCRGMQLMAVVAGGSLVQHLPDEVGSSLHDPGGDGFGEVDVRLEDGCRVAGLLGTDLVSVQCHHHQAVRQPGDLAVVGRAEDGTVEALQDDRADFWLGVQWHPEVIADVGLFRGLVEAARG